MSFSKALSLVEGTPLHGLLGLHVNAPATVDIGELSSVLDELSTMGYVHLPVVFSGITDVHEVSLWSAMLYTLARGHKCIAHVRGDQWAHWYPAVSAIVAHSKPGEQWLDYACDTFRYHAELPLSGPLPVVTNARRKELIVGNKPKPQAYVEVFKTHPGWAVEGQKIPTVRL